MGFLPKIYVKNPAMINRNARTRKNMMTTTATIKSQTRFLGLPKNRTGLFAADTIHEVKATKNTLISVPTLSPRFRNNTSTNLLFASSEQNHHQLQQFRLSSFEIQQYYPIIKSHGAVIDSSNDSRSTTNGIRNGFRPSIIRHQKLRLATAVSQRNNHSSEDKDSLPKVTFVPSQASAKLKSEIDHINNKLIKTKESSKSIRHQNSRELDDTPPSVLSYTNSYGGSSASTHQTADRIHQRFTSAITNYTGNTRPTNNTSNRTPPIPSVLLESSSPPLTIRETDENEEQVEGGGRGEEEQEEETNGDQPTHAYQIPQQSNVGTGSIFLINPPPIKKRSPRYNHRSNDMKSVSCPFYVMYLTNLTAQQRHNQDNITNDRTTFAMSSAVRRVPVNSRTSTAYGKRQFTRRRVNSPISMCTHSTLDDTDALTNSSYIHYHNRLSTKTSSIENENSSSLRDLLRTTSLNHVLV